MRIAIVSARFPFPPNRGDRHMVYHLLHALAPKHRVTLLSCVDGCEPPGALEKVAGLCERVRTVHLSRARSWLQAWAGLLSSVPSQVSYYRSNEMRRLLGEELAAQRFDLVFIVTVRMAPYVLEVRGPATALWMGDSLGLALRRSSRFAPAWKRPGIEWEARRMDRFEAKVSHFYNKSWVVSEDDRRDLERVGCARVVLGPHGADERLFAVRRVSCEHPRVMFLGSLSVPVNVDAALFAAREIWPIVRAAFPQARLRIVGADPTAVVRRLAGLPGVEVIGPVADVVDAWSGADVLLAPMRFSTGIQNKVLEAMAAGVPVVTTPPSAVSVRARPDEHLLVGEDAAALGAAVIETLRDPAAAQARADRARAHVRQHFTWGAAATWLEDVVEEASSRPIDVEARGKSG